MKLTIALSIAAAFFATNAAADDGHSDIYTIADQAILSAEVHDTLFAGGFSSNEMVFTHLTISGSIEGPCVDLDDEVWQLADSQILRDTETESLLYGTFVNNEGMTIVQLLGENYCIQWTVEYQ